MGVGNLVWLGKTPWRLRIPAAAVIHQNAVELLLNSTAESSAAGMKALASIVTVAVLVSASPASLGEGTPEAMAEAAALRWLHLVDSENYAQSWVTASDHFQSSIEQWQWVSRLSQVRTRLRKMRSRTLSSVTFARSSPGGPDGDQFVFRFATSFRKMAAATETVTVVKDPDGRWCVSAYYIGEAS
jgi:hypothetical protein